MKLPYIVWKHKTTADIKKGLYIKKAALIQLTGMAWFVALANDPSSIYAFDAIEWGVVFLATGALMYLAALNAHQAFLSNPDQPDKTPRDNENEIPNPIIPPVGNSTDKPGV